MTSAARTVLPGIVLLLVGTLLPPVCRAGLIWESNIGSPLPLVSFTPDATDGLQTVNLGAQYAIPFEGVTYNSVILASSGFIWLGGSNLAQCCVLGNPATALQSFEQGPARIAPGWADLRPDQGGAIDFNQISDANGTRSIFTYQQVSTTDPATLGAQVTFQLQLYTNGVIIFSYQHVDQTSLGAVPAMVVGLTPGMGTVPQNVDFTTLQSATTTQGVYDYIPVTSGLSLSGDSFILTPTADGWSIAAAATPEPSTLAPLAGIFSLTAFIRFRRMRSSKY